MNKLNNIILIELINNRGNIQSNKQFKIYKNLKKIMVKKTIKGQKKNFL